MINGKEEMKKLLRVSRDSEFSAEARISRELRIMKTKDIENSIMNLEISLEKALTIGGEEKILIELENVYYHIGVIKAACK